MSVRWQLACGVAVIVALTAAVWLLWQWLIAAAVVYAAVKHLTRGSRRRRPTSSWSSLGRTGAMMFAAWNTRWLAKRADGKQFRVTVPAAADGPDPDDIPF